MTKTTCPEHRRTGLTLSNGTWVCRVCGLPEAEHETILETLARKQKAATPGSS